MLAANKFVIATLMLCTSATYSVSGGDFKCYEDYRCITDTGSPQHRLLQGSYTDEEGLRKVDSRYCIALGSAYGTEIGTKYDIILENGNVLNCILADQKADRDTVDGHTRDRHGAVVEFIVDTPYLDAAVTQMGDVSYASDYFKGGIKRIVEVN